MLTTEFDMFIIVSYDIPDDRRRSRIAKVLEAHGTRVQYSVFECNLTEMQLANLKKRLARCAKSEHDSIRFYRLCKEGVGRVDIIGTEEVTVERQYYMV
jgi:CRISPR-associated protein Cas2